MQDLRVSREAGDSEGPWCYLDERLAVPFLLVIVLTGLVSFGLVAVAAVTR